LRARILELAALLGLFCVLLLPLPGQASVEIEMAFHRGVVAFGESRLDDAQAQFQKVLDADPEDTAALHYLGLIAHQRKDSAAALAFYDRALAIDPEDVDIQMDRGIAFLDADRVPAALEAFKAVIGADPDRARAHFFAGVAEYRMGRYTEAAPHFEHAVALDPELREEARYYKGLSEALAGNVQAASTAFADVQEASPMSPLGQSAQNLRQDLAPQREGRRWQASFTAGMEWDDNPLIAGTGALGVPVPGADPDWRGVLRPRASFTFLQGDNLSATAGYDGYLSFQVEEKQIDLQIHNPWVATGYDIGPVTLGLRLDYAYTMNDLTEPFRHLFRTTPTVNYRPADWALTQGFYQYNWNDFLPDLINPFTGEDLTNFINRDGWQHVFGVNQFFFLPEPFTFVRVGAYGDFNRTEGSEWSYDGMEANFGAGYDFPWDISLTWLYRFLYRAYENPTIAVVPRFAETQDVFRHVLTAEIAKGLGEHWVLSVGGAFTWNQSNVDFYAYSRHIVGTYVTYSF